MRKPSRPELMSKAPNIYAILVQPTFMAEVKRICGPAIIRGTHVNLVYDQIIRLVTKEFNAAATRELKDVFVKLAEIIIFNKIFLAKEKDGSASVETVNLSNLDQKAIGKLQKLEQHLVTVFKKNPNIKEVFNDYMFGPSLDSPKGIKYETKQPRDVALKEILDSYAKKGVVAAFSRKSHYNDAVNVASITLDNSDRVTTAIGVLLKKYMDITELRILNQNETPPTEKSRIYTKVLHPLCLKFPKEVKVALMEIREKADSNLPEHYFSEKLLEAVRSVNDLFNERQDDSTLNHH